ncbi:hypothetical protein [Streptomyces sp. NPDC006415]|uniref:hypothetical protein n=1 Tax=Streptomyces sp. NPDC006415 TaxID=3155351 RepID=UPI0033BB7D3D
MVVPSPPPTTAAAAAVGEVLEPVEIEVPVLVQAVQVPVPVEVTEVAEVTVLAEVPQVVQEVRPVVVASPRVELVERDRLRPALRVGDGGDPGVRGDGMAGAVREGVEEPAVVQRGDGTVRVGHLGPVGEVGGDLGAVRGDAGELPRVGVEDGLAAVRERGGEVA